MYPPENRLDRVTAPRRWTEGSAWFSTEADRKGRIAPGRLVDLIDRGGLAPTGGHAPTPPPSGFPRPPPPGGARAPGGQACLEAGTRLGALAGGGSGELAVVALHLALVE